jgi:hypothetical protein
MNIYLNEYSDYYSTEGYEIHIDTLGFNVFDSKTGECLTRKVFDTMQQAKHWIESKLDSERERECEMHFEQE